MPPRASVWVQLNFGVQSLELANNDDAPCAEIATDEDDDLAEDEEETVEGLSDSAGRVLRRGREPGRWAHVDDE